MPRARAIECSRCTTASQAASKASIPSRGAQPRWLSHSQRHWARASFGGGPTSSNVPYTSKMTARTFMIQWTKAEGRDDPATSALA
jgi:hypothetical protein